MASQNLVFKLISFLLFMLAIVTLFFSSRLVSHGDFLLLVKVIACIGLFIATVKLINFWTGHPYVDLGKRVLVGCGIFLLCFIGSAPFMKRRDEAPSDLKHGDSRFYMAPSGSALDYFGTSVFQERHLIGSIFIVREVCFFENEENKLSVEIIGLNKLECTSDKTQKMVSL